MLMREPTVEHAAVRVADDVGRHERRSEYSRIPFSGPSAAAWKAALISATDADVLSRAVKSVIEPSGTGTRSEVPSSLPFIASSTRPVARAAPVEVGTMLIAAARARRRSLCGPSTSIWSPV